MAETQHYNVLETELCAGYEVGFKFRISWIVNENLGAGWDSAYFTWRDSIKNHPCSRNSHHLGSQHVDIYPRIYYDSVQQRTLLVHIILFYTCSYCILSIMIMYRLLDWVYGAFQRTLQALYNVRQLPQVFRTNIIDLICPWTWYAIALLLFHVCWRSL